MKLTLFEKDNAIQILTKIGLTTSEAKIYLVFSKLTRSKVITIAKVAHLDRAETYRGIAQLEKKGFLKKIVTYPIEYEAISIEQLLPILFKKKKNELEQIKKEANQTFHHPKSKKDTPEEEEYIEFAPRIEMVFESIKRDITAVRNKIDIITSTRMLMEIGSGIREPFSKILKKGVKITMIIEKICRENDLPPYFKEYCQYQNFDLRELLSPSDVFLVIHDDSKIWIKTSSESYYESSWLVSNNRHIVMLVRNYFKLVLKDAVKASAFKGIN